MSKRKRLKIYLLLLPLLCVSIWWGYLLPGAFSQDPAGELAEKIKKLTAQLRRNRETQDAERRLLENRKSLLLEEIETLKEREKALSERRDTLEEESTQLDKKLNELSYEADLLRQSRIEAEKLVGRTAAALENHIESGLPLNIQERADTVRDMLATDDGPTEHLKLLWQLYVQEYRRAGEIELTSPAPLPASKSAPAGEAGAHAVEPASVAAVELEDGLKLPGRILRIGDVGAAFLSDSGNIAALLIKTSGGYIWRRIESGSQLSQIRNAFEIAAGRRTPHFVNIPLQLGSGNVKPAKSGGGDKK